MDEASYIIKKKEEEYINEWNQTRFICYSIIQSQSTKKLEPTDVLRFPWDEKETISPTKTKEELIQYALDMEKKLNNDGR